MKATITYNIGQDDTPIRGNVMVSGDDTYDKECEDKVIRELESGNIYAWCYLQVTATFEGFIGVAGLFGISCENEKEVKEYYYDELVAKAICDLETRLMSAQGAYDRYLEE